MGLCIVVQHLRATATAAALAAAAAGTGARTEPRTVAVAAREPADE